MGLMNIVQGSVTYVERTAQAQTWVEPERCLRTRVPLQVVASIRVYHYSFSRP